MTTLRIPSAASAVWTLASLTLRRMLRGRALWVGALIAALPVGFAAALGKRELGTYQGELFAFELLVMAVLAPMFVGASIGEEIEERTATYLWSRPIARWVVFAGKLAALVPLVIGIVLGSWCLAALIAWERVPPGASFAALALATAAVSLVATGIASLSPKHGMALTIIYVLFFDLPLGVLPATLHEASITYQARMLLDPASSVVHSIVGLVAIAGVWTLVAAWRVRRLEV